MNEEAKLAKRSCRGWGVLTFLMAFMALIGVAVLAWQPLLMRLGLASVDASEASLTTLTQQVSDQQQGLDATREELHNLKQQVVRLNQNANPSQSTWALSEVDYLLRLTQLKMAFFPDQTIITHMLTTATRRLQSLNDSDAIALSHKIEQINADINRNPGPDLQELFKQFKILTQLSTDLAMPLAPVQPNTDEEHNNASHQADTQPQSADNGRSKSQQWVQNVWHALKHIVVVRAVQETQVGYLPEEAPIAARQVQLLLAQARWAALSQHRTVYDSTLSELQNLVNATYDQKAQATQSFVQALTALQHMPVAQEWPDLTPVLHQLERLELQHTQTPGEPL